MKEHVSLAELSRKLEHSLGGPVKVFAAGSEQTQTIALVTGGAGSDIYVIAREGIDTFITGEAPTGQQSRLQSSGSTFCSADITRRRLLA